MVIKIKVSDKDKYLLAIKEDKCISIFSYRLIDECTLALRSYYTSFTDEVSFVIIGNHGIETIERVLKSFLEVK